MLQIEPDCLQALFGGRYRALPDHLEHRGFGINAPARGSDTRPAVAVEVIAGLAVRGQRFEVGAFGVSETHNRRKAWSVPTSVIRASGVLRVWAEKRVPSDVVEKMLHRPNSNAI